MALIPKPNSGVVEELVALRIDNKTIRLTKHISSSTISLYFGGHEQYCVHAQLFRKTDETPAFIDTTVGNLVQVYYHQQCSLEDNFKRGVDTTRLIKVAIHYINKEYPYVKSLKFTDASTRKCDDGTIVNLSEMSFVTYGKTWYEIYFKAFLSPRHNQQYIHEMSEFQKKKQKMSWKFLLPHITSHNPFPIGEDTMKLLYESTITWQEFFSELKERVGVSEYCSFLSSWLHSFIETFTSLRFLMMDFYIPIDSDLFEDYKEVKYNRGGKRFTRRIKINKSQVMRAIA